MVSVLLLCLCCTGFSQPVSMPSSSDATIQFAWAFGAISGKEKKAVAITHDTVLHSGDQVKFFVRLSTDCFVYVFYYNSSKEVTMLFPYQLKQFQADYDTKKNYYVPRGRIWCSFDQTKGKEVFFLLASGERLLSLERVYGDYLTAQEAGKSAAAENVLAEIRNLRRQHTDYTAMAEKPLTIGGNIRGSSSPKERHYSDLSDLATLITAKNFYSKTITIDHQ
jgi:hypothetical protein